MKKTLLALFVLLSYAAAAQVFPLQVNPQLIPPYSPYLSDYTSPGSQNFMVQIRANDIALTNYPCRLRLTIEGVGITVRTRDSFRPQPLTLTGGGTPEIFYGEDLVEYFHPDALDFSGYSRQEYEKTARLPEGVYHFSIEVLDYYRGTVVSNRGTTTAWIILNDPPVLNLPADHSTVRIQEPPNILFSWTPRHTGSPNAAFTTEYTFSLVEIWPGKENPDDAFLTQAPLYEITTAQTQVLYGLSEPTLIPGRSYAWQVTARDTGGKDLFKNKGASEVFVFQFGEALPAPENLLMRWAKPTTLAIRWDPVRHNDEEVKYRLAYRPRKRNADDNHEWYETRTKFTEKTLYDLQPETEYEVKVRTELIAQESEYTETKIFKTLKDQPNVFVCKDNIAPPPLPDDTEPVFPLSVNDTLHAGGYDVLVRDVLQVDRKYFGSGVAIVPWFNNAKVRVTFENISVNDGFWLTRGTIKSVWSPDSRFLLDVEKPVEPGQAPKAGEIDITVVATDTLIAVKGAAIATVVKDQDENIVVTTTDGEKQILRKGESYSIADEVGNGYIIDRQGNIVKTTATEARAAAVRAERDYDLRFAFEKGQGRFGFDVKSHDVLSAFYQRLDNGAYIPWKALATGYPDALVGRVTSGDAGTRKIKFRVGPSQVVPFSSSAGNFAFTLFGKAAGMEEELLALESPGDTLPDKVLGKLNLVTYNLMRYDLVIVPVNGASMPTGLSAETIAESMNRVYGQAVIEWNVAVEQSITVPLAETFDEGQPGLFTNYTGDMKKVISAYGNFRKNTFYLFLVERPRDPSTLGYMPRNRQAGFVFTEPHQGNADELAKTIAHELGHGAFNLRHIFAEYGLPMGSTDNLMDYGSGTTLCKYQWDAIHNPQTVFGLFDEKGANAMEEMTADQAWAWWQQLPPYKKAAAILEEHFDDLDIFKSVESTCDEEKCVITAELPIGDDISYTMETTFQSTMSADSLIQILYSDYRVDLWEAFDVKAENAWDELYNWWRKQNDDLAAHKGFQITALNLMADVITGASMVPSIEGWITGKHWRDGHELSGWEQVLAGLDILPASEIAGGTVSNLIVRIGRQSIRLFSIPKVARGFISNAIRSGLKVSVLSDTEFILKAGDGTALARIIKNNFYLIQDGREIAINLSKRTTILGRYLKGTEKFLSARFHDSKLFNMLDVKWPKVTAPNKISPPEAFANATEFWNLVNKQFIDDVLANGDDITLVSKPDDLQNLFYGAPKSSNVIDINGDELMDVMLTGDIDKDISILLSKKAFPTMYGREIIYLSEKLKMTVKELALLLYQ